MRRFMKRFSKQFRYGEKGFTLIELLVVIAILGILAAVAVPHVVGFIGAGAREAAAAELRTVQVAVTAAMANQRLGTITAGPFGNIPIDGDPANNVNRPVGATTVGAFITGGVAAVQGNYTIAADGTVTQVGYPGVP